MNFFELVVGSPGSIFGPLMLLTGVAAIVLCVRATLQRDRMRAKQALVWSLVPPVVGFVGAVFGTVLFVFFGQGAADPARAWMCLGGTILFGVFVSVVPALWSILLLRRRSTALA